ncbi:MAG TPA: PSD1 and planctomycete cytochrome C domain-containing protein, partial [Gemmataceae bacterium]|nr:PSD1 and planctomycete cytochrome C domain-containing protein [Gemmataceae bacterium]
MLPLSAACLALLGLGAAAARAVEPPVPARIDFNRDVRPIFSENCYACHGPDKNKRKAGLRLDNHDGIFLVKRGRHMTLPGKPDQSEVYRRVVTDDADERMPDPKSGKRLTPRQVAVLKKWIEQGAPWQGHWAYLKVVRPEVPAVDEPGFVRNPVDRFLLAKLKEVGLPHAPEADRVTLIRRLYFDLLGLPPTRAEVDAFVHDPSPGAYEKLVDRLLDAPAYGERMTMYWLDLVRYADSIGYHSDNPMNVSPYRDYVIHAFNTDKPFDQFTVEQLAGDLLPNPTLEQKVASAYNRLLQTTEEGGAQPKEYEAKYAADRVRNVSAVWLGSTMGCCQCHDHKFDPFTMRDFYSMASFFADVQEAAVGRREPGILVPSAEQAAELRRLDGQIAAAQKALAEAPAPGLEAGAAKWERTLRVAELRKLPKGLIAILLLEPAKRTPVQKQEVLAHYRTVAPELQKPRAELAALQRRKAELDKAVPHCLISVSGPPRTVHLLHRGNWQDESGPVMQPAVPAFLPQPPATGKRLTRLDLARWLVSRDNPLTARVFVNRLWKLYFGQGLSKSLEDLGSQGDWPSHPELLDYLASEFMDSGWDVKHMVKLLVTSGAYRQSSKPSEEQKERDPYNRLVDRQGRFRLDAEVVRDNALAVSGLLVRKVGGPSVKPYQPAGYWSALNFPPREWVNDKGEGLYRRGLYTHWQRSFLHPSLLAFDAPSREECCVERPRSNIPQQALVLLNDPTYVEAARVFAERIIKEGGGGVGDRLAWAFESALSRPPRPEEVAVLTALYAKHAREYAADREAARKLLATGDWPAAKDGDVAELAAWTSVA